MTTIEALQAQLAFLMAENAKLTREAEPMPVRKPNVFTEEQRKAIGAANRRLAGRDESPMTADERMVFDMTVQIQKLSCDNENAKRCKRKGSNGWWI